MGDYVKEVAVVGLVVIETTAICMGINGIFFSVVVGAICGIAGYKFGKYVCEEKT